ncbi:MAG: hypothetical protein AB7N91_18170 [Candidatus Tectimicrobiota bacterium]
MSTCTWTTTVITTVALVVTLATAALVLGRMSVTDTVLLQSALCRSTAVENDRTLPVETPYQPPRQPVVAGSASRTTTTLTLRLIDCSSYEQGYELFRALSAHGPWTLIAVLQPFTGRIDYTDSGLRPDTEYWYRLRAYNAYGEASAVSFPPLSTLNDGIIWGIQLRLQTADGSDTRPDDHLRVARHGWRLS